MAVSLKERDVVLTGKTEEGEDTIDLPVTRLGNIEDGAEIKEKPLSGDYIPIMDMEDGGKMKKTLYVPINDQTPTYNNIEILANLVTGEKLGVIFGKIAKAVDELITHLADNVKHVTAAERTAWNGKAAGNHTHDAASSTANGFMSAADKKKLDGIAEGANNYAHPTTSGNKHIPAGGASGQILRWSADGTAEWGADNNTTYAAATQLANGLMSADDKKKLDGIAENANNYTHPSYTARTGVPTANQTPAFGGTFSITQPVSDTSGHVTAMNTRTVKIPNTAASASAAGLMSVHDKTWLDGKCKRYVYGADSSATDNYGFYKIASITTATTYRTYAIKLRIASDNFVNYPKPPADITIVFRTNSTSTTTTNVYVYADSIKSPILDDIYIKYTNNTNTGTCEIYFRKTAAYQKITVDVLGEWQRGSTDAATNYQSVWTFSENNVVSASISEIGYTYSEASALASGATKAKVFKFSYTSSNVRFTVTIRQVVDSNNNFISSQAYVYTYQDNMGGLNNYVFEMTDDQKKAFVCNGVGTQWSGVGYEASFVQTNGSAELTFHSNKGHMIYINDGKVYLNLLYRAAGTHTEQSALTLTPFVDDLSPTAYASFATELAALMSVNIADMNIAEGVSSTNSTVETEVRESKYIDSNDIEFQYYEIF